MFMRTMGLRTWAKEPAPRSGNAAGPPSNVYPCKGGGANDYVFLMANTTRMWDTLCAVIGRPELVTDPRFGDLMGRLEHAKELFEIIADWTRQHSKHEVMQILGEAGVPCSATMDTQDVFTDPHLNARGFIKTVEHPVAGSVTLLGFPPRMSDSEVPIQAAPQLGEHTAAVLARDLCLSDAEIETLRTRGIVA
jgi:formyl-CoA transferase